jgi:putative phosphoesterase
VLVAVISDTHMTCAAGRPARRRLPARCTELIAQSDLLVHAGDFVTEEVLDELSRLGPPVEAVHGNVDSVALRKRLPPELLIDLPGARLGVIHDAGPSRGRFERLRARFPDAAAVVFGHSHLPLHESRAGFQIFNPGSPTERRRAPRHSMGVARVERGSIAFEHFWLSP